MAKEQILRLVDDAEIPSKVVAASNIEWGVLVDAYLLSAARVGNRYAAEVYLDRSGRTSNGMTVITPEVTKVACKNGFVMVRSICQKDHYVIVTGQS